MEEDCVFCQMVRGEEEYHEVWEDEDHLAFLANNPNTKGFTVVITKDHYPSYAFDVPEKVMIELTKATRKVGKLLDRSFDDVGRTGMIFEGYGVNHLHSKLFPNHVTDEEEWEQKTSDIDKYFEEYRGYISSHTSDIVEDEKLEKLARKIREDKKSV
jgi:diadenosine tetraphosphate (Ap4A) HIT family hydrolase